MKCICDQHFLLLLRADRELREGSGKVKKRFLVKSADEHQAMIIRQEAQKEPFFKGLGFIKMSLHWGGFFFGERLMCCLKMYCRKGKVLWSRECERGYKIRIPHYPLSRLTREHEL